jgi:hypothetical protein
MFYSFFLNLLLSSIVIPWILAPLSISTLAQASLGTGSIENKSIPAAVTYSLMGLRVLITVYILCGWSAYGTTQAIIYSSGPSVEHAWIYFVIGFFLCHGPIIYMFSKDRLRSAVGSFFGIAITMDAYIIFSIWPTLMEWPYGWFLHWVYN